MGVLEDLEQGLSYHRAGDLEKARALYLSAMKTDPSNADAMHLLGVLNAQLGRLEEGIDLTAKALETVPNNLDFASSLGRLLVSAKRYEEGREQLQFVLSQRPGDLAALVNLGVAYLDDGQPEQAKEVLEKAVSSHPDSADAHNNLANVLDVLGYADASFQAYQRALQINPGMLNARFNLALYLAKQGRDDEAIEQFRLVETVQPDFPDLHYNLGLSLKRHGEYIAAEHAYAEALKRSPSDLKSYLNLAGLLQDTARLEEAIAVHQQALAIDPDYHKAYSNMLMGLHFIPGLSAVDILEAYRDWGRRYADPLANEIQPYPNQPDPEKKLRIGFVSGGFCKHPVGYLGGAIFEHYDRSAFEFLIYETLDREDEVTRTMRSQVQEWHSVSKLDDVGIANLIREDGIDVLFDLGGHGEGGRLLTFARKPAPVQVKWIGAQHGSMGLKVMDYFITDRFETPQGQERFFDEAVVRMPDGYACFRPPSYAPEVGRLPARENGYVTFANFNNLAKLNPEVVEVWGKLLNRVPDSKMIFKTRALRDEGVRERVRAMFAQYGIDGARLDLRADSPHAELLACYNEVDIAPDPFPFSGCVTTQEALWMGVPVITKPGDIFSANHSASHLSVLGLAEFVVEDNEAYVDKIAGLAGDLDRLGELRATLRERFAASPLCDEVGFTNNLQDEIRRMWQDWCARAVD